jgi:hypothetical protein
MIPLAKNIQMANIGFQTKPIFEHFALSENKNF